MKRFKKLIALLSLLAILSSSFDNVYATSNCPGSEGCGYNDCCRVTCISPEVAVGTILLAGLITVLLHNRKQGHNPSGSSHSHSHSHSHTH